jgi:hypothetical protein
MKANSLLHRVCLCALSFVAAITLWHFPSGVHAQKTEKPKTAHPASAADKKTAASKVATRKAEALNNAEYGAKVKEYTTQPYFMTEYVDHLPASDRVPSPDKVLGYAVGAPGHLTYTKDLYRYYRELEKATTRVRTFVAPEKSEEGKEQLLVAVGDEASLAKLDRYKEITKKLADPRKISDSEAEQLIGEGKALYWASGSIHSPETGSPEMLMELAYRLAVEETPFIQAIRKNVIVLITPALEVDGRDRMVDTYNYRKANPGKGVPPLVYWGHYVAHDNNRDGLGMALALSRNQMKTFLEYHPTILHDLHESVPFLYTSTGTGPYNAWLDPIVIDEWNLLAYHEIEEMTKRGVPGVWTHGFYDGWAPNYMFYVANGHNSIGRFYETFGNSVADTLDRTVGAQSQRDWFRPNPPQPRVKWSLRNNVNLQQSAILLAMNFVSNNKDRFLKNFYLKSKRSVAKASNEGPAAWVVPSDQARMVEAADMVNLLRLMGVEVHQADKEISFKEQKFPAGSYVVRMDQPYSRMADMLLDTQYYNVNDPTPYDDTGWTLGAVRNVKTVRVTDKSVLQSPMTLLTRDAKVSGTIANVSSPAAYLINHNAENTLMTLRFKLKDLKIAAAEEPFEAGGQKFNAGTFIIRSSENSGDLRQTLAAPVADSGLKAVAVEKMPDIKSHLLAVPRIAILHTWTNTQNDGWFRVEFDRLQVPYSYISDQVIRNTPNLREKFDVIIFPPVGGSAQAIVSGIPVRGAPIPWKGSDITPNMGLGPDQSDDIRGGMTLRGVLNLQKFVEDGGVFIPITNCTRLAVDYGLVSGVAIQDARQLQARGSVYNATFSDRRSPIAYGYAETLPIYFNQAPLFQVAAGGGPGGGGGGGGGGEGGGAGARPSGRGTLTDPDIIQGMPLAEPAPPRRPGDQLTDEQRLQQGAFFTPPELRPRVVLRFVSDEKNLLISGMLAGGSELANKPAIVDVPVGQGHVVLFANNPMWRHQTQGSFFLIFNAALNYDHLSAGRDRPADQRNSGTRTEENDQ